MDLFSLVSVALSFIAIGIEAIADWQKYNYRNNPNNNGHWCEVGLWSYSRYPNYFAEITFWFSIYLSSYNALSRSQRILSLLSPMFVYYMLNHLSGILYSIINTVPINVMCILACILISNFIVGIPLLERKNEALYGHLAAYKAYKKNTNLLLPLPKIQF